MFVLYKRSLKFCIVAYVLFTFLLSSDIVKLSSSVVPLLRLNDCDISSLRQLFYPHCRWSHKTTPVGRGDGRKQVPVSRETLDGRTRSEISGTCHSVPHASPTARRRADIRI